MQRPHHWGDAIYRSAGLVCCLRGGICRESATISRRYEFVVKTDQYLTLMIRASGDYSVIGKRLTRTTLHIVQRADHEHVDTASTTRGMV